MQRRLAKRMPVLCMVAATTAHRGHALHGLHLPSLLVKPFHCCCARHAQMWVPLMRWYADQRRQLEGEMKK